MGIVSEDHPNRIWICQMVMAPLHWRNRLPESSLRIGQRFIVGDRAKPVWSAVLMLKAAGWQLNRRLIVEKPLGNSGSHREKSISEQQRYLQNVRSTVLTIISARRPFKI